MRLVLAFLAFLHLASVRADPAPLEPSSNSVFNEGSQCTILWTADPTGVWKVMNIELMTGSNEKMVHLHTVGTVDGTSTTNNTYSYPCLAVEPNSQIYFYQFTSLASTNILWTTRFTIADRDGKSVPPELQETSPSGEIIHYGIGKLQDPSLVDSPPPYGTNSTTESSSILVNGTSTGTATPTASRSVPLPTVTPNRNVSTNDGSNNNDNGAPSGSPSSSTAARPSQAQSQTGSAVSSRRIGDLGILALAILSGSLFL